MTTTLGPLDSAFHQAFQGPILSALPAPGGKRWATLEIGFAPGRWIARLDGVDLDPATLPDWDALHKALVAHMPSLLWPVSFTLRLYTAQGAWTRPELWDVSLFGHEVRFEHAGLDKDALQWYRHRAFGFDALAARFARLASALPATNQGPQMWCEGHNLMGSPHVRAEGVVARGPVEAQAKMAWLTYGWKGPAKLDPSMPAARMSRWMVSADLEDAHLDPFASLVSSRGHDDAVAAAFAAMAEDAPSDDTPPRAPA